MVAYACQYGATFLSPGAWTFPWSSVVVCDVLAVANIMAGGDWHRGKWRVKNCRNNDNLSATARIHSRFTLDLAFYVICRMKRGSRGFMDPDVHVFKSN